MQELLEHELSSVAGGCGNCEINPPSVLDSYFSHPELYIDIGLASDPPYLLFA